MMMLEKNQAKPLYQVVADSILKQIEEGAIKPGDRLPSESELCKLYQVGRNTVRHAISELADLGIVSTVQGVGSFVLEQSSRFTKTAEFLYGFSQEMALHDKVVTSKILDAKIINADPFLARRLGIQLGAEVVFLYRLRIMDGEPIAIERAYLPHQLCPGILEHDFSQESLYRVLSSQYNMKPDHAEQEIGAELATDEVARLLGLAQPGVILVFHRETRVRDGRVIEYVDSEFRADRFQFYTHLKADSFSQQFVFERLPVDSRQE
jgi:GntR family transcriptional regulator